MMRAVSVFVTTLVMVVAVAALGAVIFVYSGAYNVAADEPHWPGTRWLFQTTMDNSIEARAKDVIVPPDLGDSERINRGAAAYAQMCEVCHLAPGHDSTPAHVGLRPEPPELADADEHGPAYLFWAIKHGIKMTGMPAWGRSHDDEEIWNVVAFMRQLPRMTSREYAALTEQSSDHHHGAGEQAHHETTPREDEPG